MAISFSRPDPSSPAAVADANFPTARRGFDQQEVREFLRMVAAELARAQERERFLEQELRTRRQQQPTPVLPSELDDETVARLLGEETTRIVQAARESASAIRLRAEETAERLVRDARDEAQHLREDAELEASRRRKDAEADAEAELEMAKQQGREMVEEARAYRERALSELARRRDLARQQIDQLVHARDRLVQAFERARLAAADVVSELAPLGELDEYVNLAPTTGPVPVMVPASKLAERSSIGDDALAMRRPPEPTPPAPREDPAPERDTRAIGEHDDTVEVPRPPADDTAGSPEAPGTSGDAEATDDEATDDDATDDDATDEATEAPVDGAPDGDAHDEHDKAVDDVRVGRVGRDATVLQFPRPAPTESEDDPPLADEIDDDDVTASDIDDLFARLRSQRSPDTPGAADEQDASTVTPTDSPTDAVDATPFERRDEALTPLIVASARKLKRVLADEQNSALDRLRRPEPVRSTDELVGAADDHVARYVDAIAGELLTAARAGAESVGQKAADDVLRRDAVAPVGSAMAADLVGPLRDRLGQRIADSDGDNEAITKSARAVYREWKTKHIDDSLDDLLRTAYNRGVHASLAPGTLCRWVADPSVGACSECEDNSLQGWVPVGTAYPTGHLVAPAHPGCRCLIQPADH